MTGSSGFRRDRWATLFYEAAWIVFPLHCHIDFKIHFDAPQELEREITFQEGSGLYYYYYKHMITAPSFERGMCTLSSSHLKRCATIVTPILASQLHLFSCGACFPGLYELTLDNKTVSGQTINIVQRLSLYPELITSFIYRVTSSHVRVFLMF